MYNSTSQIIIVVKSRCTFVTRYENLECLEKLKPNIIKTDLTKRTTVVVKPEQVPHQLSYDLEEEYFID